MYIFKILIKFIVVICLALNLFGCGLYMMNQNKDLLDKTPIGTPKSSFINNIKTGYGYGGYQSCENIGKIGSKVFEVCPAHLYARDLFANNILFLNDEYIGTGNSRLFLVDYFNKLDINSNLSDYKNKSLLLITRINNSNNLLHAKLPKMGIVDLYVNDLKIGELNGDETAFIWDQEIGNVKLQIRQKDRLLNDVLIKAEKGSKYHLIYDYSTGAINLQGDETSRIILTSFPSGAVVHAGENPDLMKKTPIITPHTITRQPGSHKWPAEYYKLTLEGYKDSPVIFKNNSYGDRIVHYNFLDPSSPEPPLSELPIRRNDPSKPLIQPAIPQ